MKTMYQFKALIQTRLMVVERLFWLASRDDADALRHELAARFPGAHVHVNYVGLDHLMSVADAVRDIARDVTECDRIAVGGDQ